MIDLATLPATQERPAGCIRLGWVGRQFRCVKRKRERTQDGGIITVITARTEDPSIYEDLLTADYTTGTSVTNSIQSEAPDPPTNFAATSQPQAIEFTWDLGAFWTLNGITELWEAASGSAFNTAVKLWEGRGTRKTITKNDTTTRAYWVRMRTIAGQVSATEPLSAGVSPIPSGLAAAARRSETDDIEDNAATVVSEATDSSASLINGGGVVLDINVPAQGLSGNYLLTCTATLDVWVTNFGGGTPLFHIVINGNGSTLATGQSAVPSSTTSPGQRIAVQASATISASHEAGSGVVAQVVWTGAAPAGTAEARNITLRAEAIKR